MYFLLISRYHLLFTSLERTRSTVPPTVSFSYLCEVVQRLDDVSLDGELEQDELLSESVLRVAAELQHLPATDNSTRKNPDTERESQSEMQVSEVDTAAVLLDHTTSSTRFSLNRR